MEIITKAIGSAIVSFVIMAPIFLLATSIFCNWNWYTSMLQKKRSQSKDM